MTRILASNSDPWCFPNICALRSSRWRNCMKSLVQIGVSLERIEALDSSRLYLWRLFINWSDILRMGGDTCLVRWWYSNVRAPNPSCLLWSFHTSWSKKNFFPLLFFENEFSQAFCMVIQHFGSHQLFEGNYDTWKVCPIFTSECVSKQTLTSNFVLAKLISQLWSNTKQHFFTKFAEYVDMGGVKILYQRMG